MFKNYFKTALRNLKHNIAIITISFQSIKAGLANPLKSLRTE